MIRKILILVPLAGFLLAVSTQAHMPYQQDQKSQQPTRVQSVTGKVTQVETGGKAFSIDINQGSEKQTMHFVVDKNTTVQGHVATGTTAAVDYQEGANGQLVAVNVAEQGSQSK